MASSRMKKKSTDLGGFTIIEVVLVLAIAGLIFLMVFIALPALQRAQRDTQRRDDMARVAEAITQYQTNNNGKLPDTGAALDAVDEETNPDDLKMDNWCSGASNATSTPSQCFVKNYLNAVDVADNKNTFSDPDGTRYGLVFESAGPGTTVTLNNSADEFNKHMIHVVKHAKCDGEAAAYSSNARDYAILYKLEGSGTYCQDNQ